MAATPNVDHLDEGWPFTWCEVHFAGAVEEMVGCLVWRAKVETANELSEPACRLVKRLLVEVP